MRRFPDEPDIFTGEASADRRNLSAVCCSIARCDAQAPRREYHVGFVVVMGILARKSLFRSSDHFTRAARLSAQRQRKMPLP